MRHAGVISRCDALRLSKHHCVVVKKPRLYCHGSYIKSCCLCKRGVNQEVR